MSSDFKPEVELREVAVVDIPSSGSEAIATKEATTNPHHGAGQHHHQQHGQPGHGNPLCIGLPQVAIGVSLGFGGMGQFVAGILCYFLGETFPATTFLTYAGFFFAFGVMFCSGSGFLEAATAGGSLHELNQCMGLIQLAFAIATFFYIFGALRQPKTIILLLLLVFLTYLVGAIGAFTGNASTTKGAGWLSFLVGVVGWYIMCAFLYEDKNTMIKLPLY
ncbi:hypothetical protein VTP01DRAFT_8315 [Rhizomucor pusillus]|uniref:uncharacterized protein n=1 Tax=Rhizomucor pusillus TaxID=4840 RepID=UPI00374407BB